MMLVVNSSVSGILALYRSWYTVPNNRNQEDYMDYGDLKLPATGGGILLAGTLTGKLVSVACIAGVVLCAALIIRVLWRRKRSLGE